MFLNSECFFLDDNSAFSGMESAFSDIGKCFFLCLKGCCDGLKMLENMSDTWKWCCETRNPCQNVPFLHRQRADRCLKIFAFLSVYVVFVKKYRFLLCVFCGNVVSLLVELQCGTGCLCFCFGCCG